MNRSCQHYFLVKAQHPASLLGRNPAIWPLLMSGVVLLVSCLVGFAAQQNSLALFVVSEGERCGYINASGTISIPARFTNCEDFSGGLAPVEIDGKWGFIDQKGAVVISPQFDECRWSFSEGLAAVRLGKNWGYIDTKGDFVIPPKFDYAQGFAEGRAIVLVGQKHGVIDKTGILRTEPFDDSGWTFNDGLLEVEKDGRWGFVDIEGDVAVPIRFHRAQGFTEGLAAVEFSDDKNQWGFIDRSGKTVIVPQFQEAGYFAEGLAPVSIGFKYGYINASGELTIRPAFEMAYAFTEGLAGVIDKNHKYGFIDHSGQFVISPKYDLSFGYVNGLAAVSYAEHAQKEVPFDSPEASKLPIYEGSWGYIDKSGNEVWAPLEFRPAANKKEAQ